MTNNMHWLASLYSPIFSRLKPVSERRKQAYLSETKIFTSEIDLKLKAIGMSTLECERGDRFKRMWTKCLQSIWDRSKRVWYRSKRQLQCVQSVHACVHVDLRSIRIGTILLCEWSYSDKQCSWTELSTWNIPSQLSTDVRTAGPWRIF